MQGAARGGRPADQQAAPDDTPVVPARPASDAGTDASNKGPTSGETFNPSPAWQVQRYAAITDSLSGSGVKCDANATQISLEAAASVIMATC